MEDSSMQETYVTKRAKQYEHPIVQFKFWLIKGKIKRKHTRTIRDQCHSKEGDAVSQVFPQDQEQYNLKHQEKWKYILVRTVPNFEWTKNVDAPNGRTQWYSLIVP